MNDSRHQKKTNHSNRDEKCRQLQKSMPGGNPTHLPRRAKTGQHTHHGNGQDVFDHQNPKDQAGKPRPQHAHLLQNLGDDSGGRDGKNGPQEYGVHGTPTEQLTKPFA